MFGLIRLHFSSWLVLAIFSDLVLVGACALIWLFLYLWSDAYHESDGKRLWPRLITVGCAYILILAALTIVQRLSYHLPGSKYEGKFPSQDRKFEQKMECDIFQSKNKFLFEN